MSTDNHFDYFVIGAGSGGVRSSRITASFGAKVGIAEYKATGGTCVNVGCVPKKIMAYAADYSGHFEDARGYGWDFTGNPQFDWPRFIARKNAEIERLNGIYNGVLEKAGVQFIRGRAKFLDSRTLNIDGRKITADKILIATGGKPNTLDIPGGEHAITSDEAFYLPELPKSITIIGGGYIAVEFAHIFAGMGSKVTLSYRGDLFLNGFDRDIRETLAEEMKKSGISIHFNHVPASIEKSGDDLILKADGFADIKSNIILSAIGRSPNTDNLGLEAAGIKTHKDGRIITDAGFQTSTANIYALGDVTNKYNLTPIAIREGHILARRLFGGEPDLAMDYEMIPTAVFSQPPIAICGHTEESATANGYTIKTFKSKFRAMRHILAERQESTLMKLVVCKATDKVLGIHMIGLDAPEIMQGFAVALKAGATKVDFDRTIGIHPTVAEEFVTMR